MRKQRRNPRAAVLRALHAEPGVSVSYLSRILGIPRNTVSYHVRRLERLGEVTDIDAGERDRFLVPNTDEAMFRAVVNILLNRPNGARVLDYVAEAGGTVDTYSEIARELNLSLPTIVWHSSRLQGMGLLELRKRDDRRVQHAMTERGYQILDAIRQGQPELLSPDAYTK